MDVSLRGAVSIARRLQDPLAELVKIDPKSIGVGQYQHDISQTPLSRSLDAVVEDCVNAVGVDVNTASAPLLTRVSGITPGLAESIVAHRDATRPVPHAQGAQGRAAPRAEGVRAGGRLPPHPGRRRPARRLGRAPGGLPRRPTDARVDRAEADVAHRQHALRCRPSGRPTSSTTASACRPSPTSSASSTSPGATRDRPSRRRPSRTASRRSSDLKPGMTLEGVVTNVAAFGAFIDIGVHQDGLAHVSALSKTSCATRASRQVRRRRHGQGARRRRAAQADLADPAPRRRGDSGRPQGADGQARETSRAATRAVMARAVAARAVVARVAVARVAVARVAEVRALEPRAAGPAGTTRPPTAPWPTPCAAPVSPADRAATAPQASGAAAWKTASTLLPSGSRTKAP